MYRSHLVLVLVLVVVQCNNDDNVADTDAPVVECEGGRLRGKYMTTRRGRQFAAFLAIPYAKPPLDDLRFKAPVDAESWAPRVRDATQDSAVCTQRNPYTRSKVIEGQEDCLYLNVYTRGKRAMGMGGSVDGGNVLLPVLVWLHGGGWVCGGGTSAWYGPEVLLDRDVVLVVLNYRLGPFGFLSTQDDVVPGNMGLKDQALALRWVQHNIAAFGGDPDCVTVFGESAGGASAHLLALSPMTRGLLHRVISQSGTALCPWAFTPSTGRTPLEQAQRLATSLDCPTHHNQDMVQCLRTIDAHTIISKDHIFWEWDYDPMIPFRPMAEHEHEGAFLTEHPRQLVAAGVMSIPWVTGITSSEGALRVAGLYANPHLLHQLDEQFTRLAPISLLYNETTATASMTSHIRRFYFGDKPIDEGQDTFRDLIDLYTDAWFLSAVDESVRLQRATAPVYLYYFDHRGVASFSELFGDPHRDYGVCHADDLQYLFPVTDGLFPGRQPTEADERITDILTSMWVNFAKTGNPSLEGNELTDEVVWQPLSGDGDDDDELSYLHIGGGDDGGGGGVQTAVGTRMRSGLLQRRAAFWRTLRRRAAARDEL